MTKQDLQEELEWKNALIADLSNQVNASYEVGAKDEKDYFVEEIGKVINKINI